jgi:hypothetical protein
MEITLATTASGMSALSRMMQALEPAPTDPSGRATSRAPAPLRRREEGARSA